jgi:outer membrane protein assembly factor BamB
VPDFSVEIARALTAKKYHGFVCTADGKIGMRHASETYVQVWDIAAGRLLAQHATCFTHGLSISADGRLFVVCAWGHSSGQAGVFCHDTQTGRVVWHRRDLRQSEVSFHDACTNTWVIQRLRGSTVWLAGSSGETVQKARGQLMPLAFDGENGDLLVQARDRFMFLRSRTGEKLAQLRVPKLWWSLGLGTRLIRTPGFEWEPDRTPPIVEAASVVLGRVVLSLLRGPMMCFDRTTGECQWVAEPRCGFQFGHGQVRAAQGDIVALQYGDGTPEIAITRLRLEDGQLQDESFLNTHERALIGAASTVADEGNLIVNASGALTISQSGARTLLAFPWP